MTWEEFLFKREDYIGHDLLTVETGGNCRGPIIYVVGQGNKLIFRLSWLAYAADGKTWILDDKQCTIMTDMRYSSVSKEGKLIIIEARLLGQFLILPFGDRLSKKTTIKPQ